MTQVKICGLRSSDEVEAAAEADYAGFVVASESMRSLPIGEAKALMAVARPKRVLVTTCADPGKIESLARLLEPDVVQVHGVMSTATLVRLRRELGCQLWALLAVGSGSEKERTSQLKGHADAVVLDTESHATGGSGLTHDWEVSSAIRQAIAPTPVVLAGGLNPRNVGPAISKVRPAIVDVSSGVEKEGRKTRELIREFIERARRENA
jgi:phosphoribosylanthranilate isomerase